MGRGVTTPGIDELTGSGVGGGEGGMVGLELEDEAVEDIFEVAVRVVDLGGDRLGDTAAVGDGGARGADGGAVGGDGALQVAEDRGGEVEFCELGGVGSDKGGCFVVDDLCKIVEDGVSEVFQGSLFDLELSGECVVFDFEGVGASGAGDDENTTNDG